MSTTAIHALPDLPLAMPTWQPLPQGGTPAPSPAHDTTPVGALDTRAVLVPALTASTPTPPEATPAQAAADPSPGVAPVTVLAPALTQPLTAMQPPSGATTPEPGSPWAGSGHAPVGQAMAPPIPLPKRVPATLAHTRAGSDTALPPPVVPQEILDARAQAKGQEVLDDHVRVFLHRRRLMIAVMTGVVSAPLFSLTTAHYAGWGLIPLTLLSTITCVLIAVLRLGHLTAAVVHGLPGSFLIILLTAGSPFGIIAGMGIILSGTLLSVWLDERRSVGQ